MPHPRAFWYVAAEAKDLGTKPLARRLLGEDLVLYRDARGQVVALHDRCPHRGAALSPGRVVLGELECPYHGWRFGAQGQCRQVPSLAEGQAIPSACHAQGRPALEQDGYLWVWMGEASPGPEDRPFAIPHLGDPAWGHRRLRCEIPAEAGACVENFIDTTHTGYVHGGLFRQPASHGATNQVRAVADGVIIDIEEDEAKPGFLGHFLLGPEVPQHQDRFFLPATVQVHYRFSPTREVIGWQFCTPIDEERTLVHVHVAHRLGWLNPLARLAIPFIGKVILDQDLRILKTLRPGDRQANTPADLGNLWIRQAMDRAARGEAPGPEREATVHFRL